MKMQNIFPASTSNQITKDYYNTLVGQINRGTCSKQVQRVIHQNGTHTYETYHLISVK